MSSLTANSFSLLFLELDSGQLHLSQISPSRSRDGSRIALWVHPARDALRSKVCTRTHTICGGCVEGQWVWLGAWAIRGCGPPAGFPGSALQFLPWSQMLTNKLPRAADSMRTRANQIRVAVRVIDVSLIHGGHS